MSGTQQSKLIQEIIEAGKNAYDPALEVTSLDELEELFERTDTYTLLPALNSLIKPNVLPPWLRGPLMQQLTHLPLQSDGVRGTLEFVFSVHPSNVRGATESTQPQKQGASITHEAVAMASKLLSSVPTTMTPFEWFQGVSGQLFSLIDGDAGPDLAKTAAQIVGFGILGKKQLGAPGAPGWLAFVQPLLEDINPSLRSASRTSERQDDVVDLSQDAIVVSAKSLSQSLARLRTLVLSNSSPGLSWRLLKQVVYQTWALAAWSNPSAKISDNYCKPARELVQTYLTLFGKSDTITPLIANLLCKGCSPGSELKWHYRSSADGAIQLVEPRFLEDGYAIDLDWGEIEVKASLVVQMMTANCPAEEVSSTFLHLLRHWIQNTQAKDNVTIKVTEEDRPTDSPVQDLIKITVLQKLMEGASDKLVSHFDQLIELVCLFLRVDRKTRLDDEAIAVVLSLLNLVVTAPTFRKSDINPDDVRTIEESLDAISEQNRSDASTTARNLGMLLKYRDELDPGGKETAPASARQVEDRKTYKLAMEYITGAENPPPVVSEGLNLISDLIIAESPILDITAITVLMSDLLRDNDDYINLRVIKIFTVLANRHPRSTTEELTDHYLDAQEKLPTDVRLRFGEALLQVIERHGQTFAGTVAERVSETLLSIAGRRGFRPKTMKKQRREEQLQKLKAAKGDSSPIEDDIDPDDEEITEEKARNDVLAQILHGWESKRGAEDVRMRASSLSILGSALETNMAGVGPTRVSAAVDLCLNVLAMEPEMEKAILRRAAIIVILSFVKGLSDAAESGRRLGFGLTDSSREDIVTTLGYIAGTDNDGLVQQHARDVIESLEHWQIGSLLPQQTDTGASGLTKLAGLDVKPDLPLLGANGSGSRPRIEEVE